MAEVSDRVWSFRDGTERIILRRSVEYGMSRYVSLSSFRPLSREASSLFFFFVNRSFFLGLTSPFFRLGR